MALTNAFSYATNGNEQVKCCISGTRLFLLLLPLKLELYFPTSHRDWENT